ncbi:MAG: hypothetical protein WC389_12065 [Lutibacter sp.]
MSSLLLIALITFPIAVTFRRSVFQSRIKNSEALESLYTKDLSGSKQFNLCASDKSFGIIKAAATNLSKSHLSHNGNWKIDIAAVFCLK